MTVTLVYGGTFDPVHLGHIQCARALVEMLGDASISLVPCQIPPHRPEPSAGPEHRLAMLKLAVHGLDSVQVDDCELRRTGPSFTIDTLKAYRDQLGPDASLGFVMGADAWVTLPSWRDWQKFLSVGHIVVLDREGALAEPAELKRWVTGREVSDVSVLVSEPAGKVCHVRQGRWRVSATLIRNRVAAGDSLDGLLPPAVERYILDNGLYLSREDEQIGL